MAVGDSSLAGDREVCSSHLSSPPWPPRGWWVPGPPAAWGASMQYVHFRPLVGRQKLLMCSLLLSLMDLLLSFALVLFPATKQRESLTLGCCMGLLWLGDNAKRDGVQMGSAGAFCCRSLPEWCVEHAWMILHRELITEWFSDRWYPPFLSQAPIIRLISATRVQLAALATYIYSQLLFSASCNVLAGFKTEPLQCITVSALQCLLMQAWRWSAAPFRTAKYYFAAL